MPSLEIPSSECDAKKQEIEGDNPNFKVISCEPIPEKPGFSLITWETTINMPSP